MAKKKFKVNGHEYNRAILTVGKDYKGKTIQKIFYGKTLTEANEKKDNYKEQIATGINPKLTGQSLSQAMYIWLWNVEFNSKNKSSTFERYEGIYRNYIKDKEIGKIIFEDITSLTIQIHLKGMFDEGYTYSQMSNLIKSLKKFFNYAIREGYILRNPCTGVKIPKNDEEEIYNFIDDDFDDFIEPYDAFTEEELKKIFKYLTHENMLRYIAITAFFTGAREGELLAIDRNKDIKNNKIRINKTVKRVKVFTSPTEYSYELKVTKPKSKNSTRIAPVNDILEKELKQLYKLISIEKLKAGQNYNDIGLLFPNEIGGYIDASNLLKLWKKTLNDAEVEYKKFHALRDTFASLMSKNEVPIEVVSKLLGHSSIRTTEKYYINIDKERQDAGLNKIKNILSL